MHDAAEQRAAEQPQEQADHWQLLCVIEASARRGRCGWRTPIGVS